MQYLVVGLEFSWKLLFYGQKVPSLMHATSCGVLLFEMIVAPAPFGHVRFK